MTEIELRNKVAACARSWLGRREADGSHRPIIDTYNSIVPLPRGYRMTYADPWCAAFVSAVGKACGLTDIILPECSCERMIALYRSAGRWVESDAYIPHVGDLIFYDWQDSGAGDNTGEADHVGIVIDVSGNTITVIEGNKSDSVSYRSIPVNGRHIRGFAIPDYASKAGSAQEDKPADPDPTPEPGTSAELIDHTGAQNEDVTVKPGAGAVWLPTLREGDESVAVRSAQTLLIGRGHYCGGKIRGGAEIPDGEFGPVTAAAVRTFQIDARLTADSVIGSETWEALITK